VEGEKKHRNAGTFHKKEEQPKPYLSALRMRRSGKKTERGSEKRKGGKGALRGKIAENFLMI